MEDISLVSDVANLILTGLCGHCGGHFIQNKILYEEKAMKALLALLLKFERQDYDGLILTT